MPVRGVPDQMTQIPELFSNQKTIVKRAEDQKRLLIFSDPGTGKTAAMLNCLRYSEGRALAITPKSIMVPAWVRDCQAFTPHLSIEVAIAPEKLRRSAFASGSDVVVINHGGVKWLAKNQGLLEGFDTLIIDESTAFKHPGAARSKALASIRGHFDRRYALTGTPIANNLIDIWHQVFLIDDGEHLGSRYYAFRAATHDPIPQPGGFTRWDVRDGSVETVMDLISPICLRFKLEDCVDMPPHRVSHRMVDLSGQLRRYYDRMAKDAVLALTKDDAEIEAVHAAAVRSKLMQIASGSVYGGDKSAYELGRERYDLIAQLVEERTRPCVIGFQWKHQRDGIIEALERAKLGTPLIIDGDHNKDVDATVTAFQSGKHRAILAPPKTAGHGLTLTAGGTTIWSSPIYDAELYEQLNRRIYRAGQKGSTETIIVAANDTVDEIALERLTGRVATQSDALALLKTLTFA